MAVSVDAHPFVSEHLFHAIERVTAFASTVDDPFADNFGGVVAQESVLTVQKVASESGEEVPSPVMTLLEIDAEFGSLSATDVLAVCGPDRERIADYEAYCADQARSWRDYAQEAYDGGDMDVARSSEREAIPWDRVVVALRTALGTVGFFDNA